MTMLRTTLALIVTWVFVNSVAAQTPSPAGGKVYIINLKDGTKIKSPFLVQFGLAGMGVAPAGVEKPNTGHHHLLIDTSLTVDQMKGAIPADDTHKHFGDGQTETMVTLPQGKDTFQLELAYCSEVPHAPPVMSKPITVSVR